MFIDRVPSLTRFGVFVPTYTNAPTWSVLEINDIYLLKMDEAENETVNYSHNSEVVYQKDPEVIANDPIPNTELIISIPTYHQEWSRGTLMRSVEAMLSQNTSSSAAMEVNYVMNTGDLHPWKEVYDREKNDWVKKPNTDPSAQEAYKKAQEGISFLSTIVKVQELARSGNNQNEIDDLLNTYEDPHLKQVLELAVKKADHIAISAIDTTKCDLNALGSSDTIDGFRTVGVDYAVERFKNNPNGIFLISDTDTVPAFNSMGKDLIETFHKNPQSKYFFLRMGYVAPGEDKMIVNTSTQFIGSKVGEYNLKQTVGAPQIALRIDALSQVSEVSRMFGEATQGDEDRDTSERIIGLFGHTSQDLLLESPDLSIPIQLTQDRTMGLSDGAHRAEMGKKIEDIGFDSQLSGLESRHTELLMEVKQEIESAPSSVRQKLESELENVRHQIEMKQKAISRFNREVMSDFLQVRDLIPKDPSVPLSLETKNNILHNQKRGTALLGYIEQNRNLITQLNDEDISVIEYFLGTREEKPVEELSTFHKTIREYIGEYPKDSSNTDRTMVMQPALTDIIAYGHIHSMYGQRKLIHEGSSDKLTPPKPEGWFENINDFQGRFPNRDKSWTKNIAS